MEVKRALLEQAYAMLSSNKTHIRVVMSRDETCVAIRAALAAPATAPAKPAWNNVPTCEGLWVCRQAITDNVQAYEVTDQMALNRNLKLKGQWYGPIPEDKP